MNSFSFVVAPQRQLHMKIENDININRRYINYLNNNEIDNAKQYYNMTVCALNVNNNTFCPELYWGCGEFAVLG